MTTSPEFKKFAHEMVDYVIDYLENIRDRPVLSKVKPGYLKELLPSEAPEKAEQWADLMKGKVVF